MIDGLRKYYIFTMRPGLTTYYLTRGLSTHRYTKWGKNPVCSLKFETREDAMSFYKEVKQELCNFSVTLVEVYRDYTEEEKEKEVLFIAKTNGETHE